MKKLNTKDIITLLPLGDDLQKKLLSEFDSLNTDQKFEMEKVLWGAYDAFCEAKVEKKLELQYEEALHGTRELDSDFYNDAEKVIVQEEQTKVSNVASSQDLETVRNKLQSLMQTA